MAISTYTELQSIVDAYLGHGLFTARVPDFITMFEASANRRLRVRQQESDHTVTPVDGFADLPSDFLAMRDVLRLTSSSATPLEYVQPSYGYAAYPAYPGTSDGTAKFWTTNGGQLRILPEDSSATFEMRYWAKIPALSDSNTTNWLLTAHPDLYVFGSLCEAELFGVNDTRAALWKTRRDEIFGEIEKLSLRYQAASGARVRVMQATP